MFRPRKFTSLTARSQGYAGFEQALPDTRRPGCVDGRRDVRDPETMRLTLSASETGHLVMRRSTRLVEALQRVVSFSGRNSERRFSTLADCLLAVISTTTFRPEINMRVPEWKFNANECDRNFIVTATLKLLRRDARRNVDVSFRGIERG